MVWGIPAKYVESFSKYPESNWIAHINGQNCPKVMTLLEPLNHVSYEMITSQLWNMKPWDLQSKISWWHFSRFILYYSGTIHEILNLLKGVIKIILDKAPDVLKDFT